MWIVVKNKVKITLILLLRNTPLIFREHLFERLSVYNVSIRLFFNTAKWYKVLWIFEPIPSIVGYLDCFQFSLIMQCCAEQPNSCFFACFLIISLSMHCLKQTGSRWVCSDLNCSEGCNVTCCWFNARPAFPRVILPVVLFPGSCSTTQAWHPASWTNSRWNALPTRWGCPRSAGPRRSPPRSSCRLSEYRERGPSWASAVCAWFWLMESYSCEIVFFSLKKASVKIRNPAYR